MSQTGMGGAQAVVYDGHVVFGRHRGESAGESHGGISREGRGDQGTCRVKLRQGCALQRDVNGAQADVHANVGGEVVRLAHNKRRDDVGLIGVKLVGELRDCMRWKRCAWEVQAGRAECGM